jgi:hypothetical protein
MTQDEIIELARQAGIKCRTEKGVFCSKYIDGIIDDDLEAFARLVAEKEREACAKLCDLAMLQNQEAINELKDEHIAQCFVQGAMNQLVKTAKAIRAREQS